MKLTACVKQITDATWQDPRISPAQVALADLSPMDRRGGAEFVRISIRVREVLARRVGAPTAQLFGECFDWEMVAVHISLVGKGQADVSTSSEVRGIIRITENIIIQALCLDA